MAPQLVQGAASREEGAAAGEWAALAQGGVAEGVEELGEAGSSRAALRQSGR